MPGWACARVRELAGRLPGWHGRRKEETSGGHREHGWRGPGKPAQGLPRAVLDATLSTFWEVGAQRL